MLLCKKYVRIKIYITKGMGEITVVQRLLDVAYSYMEAFRKKRGVDTQSRKVTDKIVASVFTKNK